MIVFGLHCHDKKTSNRLCTYISKQTLQVKGGTGGGINAQTCITYYESKVHVYCINTLKGNCLVSIKVYSYCDMQNKSAKWVHQMYTYFDNLYTCI